MKYLFIIILLCGFRGVFAQDVPSGQPFWLNSAQNPALLGTSVNKFKSAIRYASSNQDYSYFNAGAELGLLPQEGVNTFGIGLNYQQIKYPIFSETANASLINYQNIIIPFSYVIRNLDKGFSMGLSLGYEQYSLGDDVGVYYSQLDPNSNNTSSSPSYSLDSRTEGTIDVGVGLSYFTHEHFMLSISAKHLQHLIKSEGNQSLFQQHYPLIEGFGQYIFSNPIKTTALITTAGYVWNKNSQRGYLSVEYQLSVMKFGVGYTPFYQDEKIDHFGFVSSSVAIPFGEKASINKRGRIIKSSDNITLNVLYYPTVDKATSIYPTLEFTLGINLSKSSYKNRLSKYTTLPRD
ncbi:PorP/SprF family type IX secretion system membrane protein [Flammeovirga pacifica]|uniref:Type IX secretion system membrane protein PorP/SprF n=1 Tax=Flammeovirga pacifica TaxID=915059 RepID=A0A1S1Z212_FLAPC|nr:hypothetical protein [Flammeovirga pacifica]OHX67281.1 hypothetical protein NH26_13490 [Flammeovirga pacifica]